MFKKQSLDTILGSLEKTRQQLAHYRAVQFEKNEVERAMLEDLRRNITDRQSEIDRAARVEKKVGDLID